MAISINIQYEICEKYTYLCNLKSGTVENAIFGNFYPFWTFYVKFGSKNVQLRQGFKKK